MVWMQECSGKLAETSECNSAEKGQIRGEDMLQGTLPSSAAAGGLLDDEYNDDQGLLHSAEVVVHPEKQRRALLSDDHDYIIEATGHLYPRKPSFEGNALVNSVPSEDAKALGHGGPATAPGLGFDHRSAPNDPHICAVSQIDLPDSERSPKMLIQGTVSSTRLSSEKLCSVGPDGAKTDQRCTGPYSGTVAIPVEDVLASSDVGVCDPRPKPEAQAGRGACGHGDAVLDVSSGHLCKRPASSPAWSPFAQKTDSRKSEERADVLSRRVFVEPAAAVTTACPSVTACQDRPQAAVLNAAAASACVPDTESTRIHSCRSKVAGVNAAALESDRDREAVKGGGTEPGHANRTVSVQKQFQVQSNMKGGSILDNSMEEGASRGSHQVDTNDVSPLPLPFVEQHRSSGDRTPDMATSHSGQLRSRSATRSVTFSDVTTDLVSGPMHEWQGSRQSRREGVEERPAGALQLPRPALKQQCRVTGTLKSLAGDSPPLQLAAATSVAELPPSFGISLEEATVDACTVASYERLPLSPIKANVAKLNATAPPVAPVTTSVPTVPGSHGKRPRTKKARLEAMRASKEAQCSPDSPFQPGAGDDATAVRKDGACTLKGLSGRERNVLNKRCA